MLANPDRAVPVPTWNVITRRRLRLDADELTGDAINPGKITLLRLRVHNVGIAGFSGRLVPIASERYEPVVIANALTIVGA